MIIPSIRTKGVFTFKEPFDKAIGNDKLLTVVSVRDIIELDDGGERPYETIYKPLNITEDEYIEDYKNEMSIVVFRNDAKEYFYVPANRILSEGINTGVPYSEFTLYAVLGNHEVHTNFEHVIDEVTSVIYNRLGVEPYVKLLQSSDKFNVDDVTHESNMKERENIITINKSCKTLYAELLEKYSKQQDLIKRFEKMYKHNVCDD